MPDMTATPITDPAPTQTPAQAASAVARALDAILGSLCNLLWTRALTAYLLGALAGPVITRLLRTRERLARALAHLAAGHVPRAPSPRKRPSGPRTSFPNRRPGWLGTMLDHHVRNTASQLAFLLHQPGVAETLAASPAAARTLRPLCRMLGVELPAPLRLPPPPPRAAPPPKPPQANPPGPRPPKLPPLNPPLQPYVLAAARAWKRPEIKTA